LSVVFSENRYPFFAITRQLSIADVSQGRRPADSRRLCVKSPEMFAVTAADDRDPPILPTDAPPLRVGTGFVSFLQRFTTKRGRPAASG
jgi:hypothetical protein